MCDDFSRLKVIHHCLSWKHEIAKHEVTNMPLDLRVPGSWPQTGLATTYEEYSANMVLCLVSGPFPAMKRWVGPGTRLGAILIVVLTNDVANAGI